MKKVFIVHGWDSYPDDAWLGWLSTELTRRNFQVIAPALPDPEFPHINTWVPALAAAVGTPDADTVFVGHSMGCQTIARYLETLPDNVIVGGAVFVAGFFKRLSLGEEPPEVEKIDREWLEAPIDLEKVARHLPHSIAIFSDNDSVVPPDNQEDFKTILHSRIIIEHERGHFSGSEGVNKLPSALDAVLSLS